MTLRPGVPQEIHLLSPGRTKAPRWIWKEMLEGLLGDSVLQSAGRLGGGQAMCCGGRIRISLVCAPNGDNLWHCLKKDSPTFLSQLRGERLSKRCLGFGGLRRKRPAGPVGGNRCGSRVAVVGPPETPDDCFKGPGSTVASWLAAGSRTISSARAWQV